MCTCLGFVMCGSVLDWPTDFANEYLGGGVLHGGNVQNRVSHGPKGPPDYNLTATQLQPDCNSTAMRLQLNYNPTATPGGGGDTRV